IVNDVSDPLHLHIGIIIDMDGKDLFYDIAKKIDVRPLEPSHILFIFNSVAYRRYGVDLVYTLFIQEGRLFLAYFLCDKIAVVNIDIPWQAKHSDSLVSLINTHDHYGIEIPAHHVGCGDQDVYAVG